MRDSYYVEVRKRPARGDAHLVLYGPADDEDQALAHALLLHGLDAVWEQVRGTRRSWRQVLGRFVPRYSDGEIAYMSDYPDEARLASFAVRPLSAIRMHPSWRGRTWHGHPVRTRAEALAIASQFLD